MWRARLRRIESNGDNAVLRLGPYVLLAEHRVVTKNRAASGSIYKDEAELYYVIEGSATLVTRRMPDQPRAGAMQQIHKGDVLIIPARIGLVQSTKLYRTFQCTCRARILLPADDSRTKELLCAGGRDHRRPQTQ